MNTQTPIADTNLPAPASAPAARMPRRAWRCTCSNLWVSMAKQAKPVPKALPNTSAGLLKWSQA